MCRMPFGRPLPIAYVAALVAWAVLGPPATAAANDSACVEASAAAADAMAAGRWQEATEILRPSIRRSECAGVATEQLFSLAYATEQMVPDDPGRACEAEKLYLAVLDRNPDPQFTDGARKGSRRMRALCNRCRSAQEAIAQGAWARAERKLRADLGLKSCESEDARLRFELAEVVEQLVVDRPARACEAQTLYRASAATAPSERDLMRANAGAARMKLLCDRQPDQDGADTASGPVAARSTAAPPAHPQRERTAALWTTIGAGVAVVAGAGMVYGSLLQEEEWNTALSLRSAAHAEGDASGVADAEERFNDAASLGPTLNVAGWSAIGVGAALGALATWMWMDGPEVEATIGPGSAGVMVRF